MDNSQTIYFKTVAQYNCCYIQLENNDVVDAYQLSSSSDATDVVVTCDAEHLT